MGDTSAHSDAHARFELKAKMSQTGATQLHELASNSESVAEIEASIEAGINVNGVDAEGDTALHIAARTGSLEVCKVLVEHGADLLLRNKKNRTAAGQARLDEELKDWLVIAEADAKERRKQRAADMWNSKIQATQTESALAVGTL